MKAQKLPSGSYRVRVYDSESKKYISFTEPTEDEAIYQAMAYKTHRTYKKKAHSPTIGECVDNYINSKENVLSPKTIYVYRQIRNNGLADLCPIPVSEITNQQIQDNINRLALKRSAKTVRNAHGLLAAVLNLYAPEFRLRVTLPKLQKKIKEFPEIVDLVKAVEDTEIEIPCLLALWLGLRMSEIRGAKRTDIKDGILTIHSTIITVGGQHIEKESTKTYESTRQLSLPERLKRLINDLPANQVYLTPYSGQTIYLYFKRILEENNLPSITFHDLRHLNASIMLQLGIPDKYAMERGGWSNPSVMKNVYQHTFSDERKKVDKRIDGYFEALYDTKNDTK